MGARMLRGSTVQLAPSVVAPHAPHFVLTQIVDFGSAMLARKREAPYSFLADYWMWVMTER